LGLETSFSFWVELGLGFEFTELEECELHEERRTLRTTKRGGAIG